MAEEKILVEGLRKFSPHSNAPEWVKGSLVITPRKFLDWLKSHPELLTEYQGEKQINLQELESKEGKLYFVVDTWKPDAEKKTAPVTQSKATQTSGSSLEELPF